MKPAAKTSVLHIISSSYPYGSLEQPYEVEIRELSRYFDEIVIYPLSSSPVIRTVPENVQINLTLSTFNRKIKFTRFLSHFWFLTRTIMFEITRSGSFFQALRNLRYIVNSLLQCYLLGDAIYKLFDQNKENYFYSLWMNDGALIFSILKDRKKIKKFAFRVNGYDLFEERVKNGYLPFRNYNYDKADKVISVSRFGAEYLKRKTKYANKITWNFCGIYDPGVNPLDPSGVYTLVSCSAVIHLKRIDKIIESLRYLDFPVRWIHFGNGKLFEEILTQSKSLPNNISVEFMGETKNSEVMKFYSSTSVNAFIHLSESEGLGLAIIEAQSFGIPAIAVNSDAVCDIVNDSTGILLPAFSEPAEIAKAIKEHRGGYKNTVQFRKGVKEYWKGNFDAVHNYQALFNLLVNNDGVRKE